MAIYLDGGKFDDKLWFETYPGHHEAFAGARDEEILARLPEDVPLRGVEVGVYKGWLAERLLKARPLLNLTLVDTFITPELLKVTEFAANRRRIVNLPSVQAARGCFGERFDFVFIDADHEYEAVLQDVIAWRPGTALLCGHDYKRVAHMFNGVARAVDQLLPKVELGRDMTWFSGS
jgi:hypothetical protein